MKKLLTICLVLLVAGMVRADYLIDPFVICERAGVQVWPDIYGDYVVYYDDQGDANTNIYGFKISTGEEFLICDANDRQFCPVIGGDIVVWCDYRNYYTTGADIYGYNLLTQEEFIVCNEIGDQVFPAISEDGRTVVWSDSRNDSFDIYGRYLYEPNSFMICNAVRTQYMPAIDNGFVVWYDLRFNNWDIYGVDLMSGQVVNISHAGGQMYPDISNNWIVYMDDPTGQFLDTNIYRYNIGTGARTLITNAFAYQTGVVIDRNIIVWADCRNDFGNIYGYDLDTNQEFPICMASGEQLLPAVSGDVVVWTDKRNGNEDIMGARLVRKADVDGDLDYDSDVDFDDFAIMAQNWLKTY